jgi:hypothetical protein
MCHRLESSNDREKSETYRAPIGVGGFPDEKTAHKHLFSGRLDTVPVTEWIQVLAKLETKGILGSLRRAVSRAGVPTIGNC